LIIPVLILAVMFATIPVEANTSSNKNKQITQKQAKELRLTQTKRPVRSSSLNNIKDKNCVTMVDKRTRKQYIVCPE
jgi:hypothetical protein